MLYSHWSKMESEGMYWTIRVLVPVYQAMCHYARLSEKFKKKKKCVRYCWKFPYRMKDVWRMNVLRPYVCIYETVLYACVCECVCVC